MLGSKIKELRELHKLTQKEFGEKVGLTESAISHFERNKKSPSRETIENIAKSFNVSVDYLLDREIHKDKVDRVMEVFASYGFDKENDSEEMEKILEMAVELYKMKKGL